jgi:hypothetical protein
MQLEREVTKKTQKVCAERSLRTTGLNHSPFGEHGAPLRRLAGNAPGLSCLLSNRCVATGRVERAVWHFD